MKRLKIILLISILISLPCQAISETIISEDLNDASYSSPLLFYNVTGYDANLKYVKGGPFSDSGNCLEWNHSQSYAGLAMLGNFHQYVDDGVYIRYWVKFDTNYLFPAELGDFDNFKMFKLAGNSGYDIEFIYKNTSSGPSNLQLYWMTPSGSVGGTKTGNVSMGQTMEKGKWHKIEIYIKVGNPSQIHVQINDKDVYENLNADINLPATAYTGTQQFQSLRVGSTPSSSQAIWYTDNYTVIHNEGDLTNNEPPEPSGGSQAIMILPASNLQKL